MTQHTVSDKTAEMTDLDIGLRLTVVKHQVNGDA